MDARAAGAGRATPRPCLLRQASPSAGSGQAAGHRREEPRSISSTGSRADVTARSISSAARSRLRASGTCAAASSTVSEIVSTTAPIRARAGGGRRAPSPRRPRGAPRATAPATVCVRGEPAASDGIRSPRRAAPSVKAMKRTSGTAGSPRSREASTSLEDCRPGVPEGRRADVGFLRGRACLASPVPAGSGANLSPALKLPAGGLKMPGSCPDGSIAQLTWMNACRLRGEA